MEHYTQVFVFDSKKTHVALIKKNRGGDTQGKLIGIGGKIERKDTNCFTAASREVREETGVSIRPKDLIYFTSFFWRTKNNPASRVHRVHRVHNFYAITDDIFCMKSITDEEVDFYPVNGLKMYPIHKNIPWLVEMCLDDSIIACSPQKVGYINRNPYVRASRVQTRSPIDVSNMIWPTHYSILLENIDD